MLRGVRVTMSDRGDRLFMLEGERNTESPKTFSDLGTRPRTLSRKALQDATERKRYVVSTLHDKRRQILRSVVEAKQGHNWDNILNDLVTVIKDLKGTLIELENLYANDKYGDYKGETSITNGRWSAGALIEEIKHEEAQKLSETHSRQSRRSRRSKSTCSNSRSSTARIKASAEAAAARENAQFERLIAEKELAHKEREQR